MADCSEKPELRLQFRLVWLILACLTLGPFLGLAGRVAKQVYQEFHAPPPLPAANFPASAFTAVPPDYYESGETPLD